MRRLLLVLAALLGVLLVTIPAYADPVDDAVSALSGKTKAVYVAPNAEVKVAGDAVDGAKGPMLVAALPASATAPSQIAATIGHRVLGTTRGVVVVIAGTKAGFDSNISTAATDAIDRAGQSALDQHPLSSGGDATPFITALVGRIDAVAPSGASGGGGGNGGGGGHTGLIVAIVLIVLVVAGIGGWLMRRRSRERTRLAGRRADVISLYDRLGADVSNLDAKDDPVARQALADAAERYNATGSQLEGANSDGEYDAARRTAIEGLQAARTARKRLGLDPGPEIPELRPRGERLAEEREFTVGERTVRGYPDYTPGAPYYYGGGGGFGAGWYTFPFWETLLVGSMLGGFGGWGGGGYDAGYDSGYQAGYDQAQDSGGGWGDGGDSGGDWGGGDSGGWGDSGGDWGGGGGDWGGGDSGGGW